MSKLATFLCAVLVASAVNASYVSDALVSAEATVEALIGTIIFATKHKFDDLKLKAEEDVANLEAAAKAGTDSAFLRVKSTLGEVQVEINKLPSNTPSNKLELKEDGSKITDFKKLVVDLENIGLSAIVNMSTCVDDKLATGRRYTQNIFTLLEDVLANLTAIREEARHCGDNVDGIKTAAAAIECINVAGLKATWIETTGVPSLTIEMTKITNSFADLTFAPIHCEITGGFITFLEETEFIFKKIRQIRRVSSWFRGSLNTYSKYLGRFNLKVPEKVKVFA